jgi:hypothetical protein
MCLRSLRPPWLVLPRARQETLLPLSEMGDCSEAAELVGGFRYLSAGSGVFVKKDRSNELFARNLLER